MDKLNLPIDRQQIFIRVLFGLTVLLALVAVAWFPSYIAPRDTALGFVQNVVSYCDQFYTGHVSFTPQAVDGFKGVALSCTGDTAK